MKFANVGFNNMINAARVVGSGDAPAGNLGVREVAEEE